MAGLTVEAGEETMEKKYLPEEKMLPLVHIVRRFVAGKGKGQPAAGTVRTVTGYETGIYLTDGGSITINGVRHPLKRYHIRFLRQGDRVSSEPEYTCDSIYFDFGEEDVFYENEMLSAIPSFFAGNESHGFLFQRIAECAKNEETGSAVMLNGLLLQLLGSYYHLTHSRDHYSEVVVACLNYMKEHMGGHVTLAELGTYTGYSPLHVLRLFKDGTGRTPHAHLTNMRISYAKELLTEENTTLAAVASACGFESESHFQSLFKKQTGITPGKYRKSARELY